MNTAVYVQTEADCSVATICKWTQSRLYEHRGSQLCPS